MKRRQLILVASLGATLAASWWASGLESGADGAEPAPVAQARSAPHRPARRAPAAPPSLAGLDGARAGFGEAAPPVFGLPPPPPPPPSAAALAAMRPAPAPRPVAPALPYTYIGSLQEAGGERVIFLLDGERLVTARVGEVLDERYRINAADETAVTLTYLPLKQTQRLSLADRS
ncbi:hypothetical protein G3580_00310 [Nitrogeniibacter mangrovi]|uniref:Secretion system X translation initiation factor n=1 Tax=Nitrogeniibacter mangrovi TaxID=2016596 RepID=A0A6C1AXW3_9RHOO|nr:hypothetical protein [Nitrogeniibacter mangrovi]QID16201.1 hypothetical protein G3580_00310 [Nitrogeniibacter mangrovi]